MAQLIVGVVDVYLLDQRDRLRVLLLRRAKGTRCTGAWEVVHGSLLDAERPEDGAEREVGEETGLRVDRLYNVTCQPFYLHRSATVQMAVVFAAFADSRLPLRLSAEHDMGEWLALEEAADRVTWPRSRQALRDIQALLGTGHAGPVEDVLRVR
jgi:dihydroneopterin triphosphate diphosphatase